jgi:hypothetical protein
MRKLLPVPDTQVGAAGMNPHSIPHLLSWNTDVPCKLEQQINILSKTFENSVPFFKFVA